MSKSLTDSVQLVCGDAFLRDRTIFYNGDHENSFRAALMLALRNRHKVERFAHLSIRGCTFGEGGSDLVKKMLQLRHIGIRTLQIGWFSSDYSILLDDVVSGETAEIDLTALNIVKLLRQALTTTHGFGTIVFQALDSTPPVVVRWLFENPRLFEHLHTMEFYLGRNHTPARLNRLLKIFPTKMRRPVDHIILNAENWDAKDASQTALLRFAAQNTKRLSVRTYSVGGDCAFDLESGIVTLPSPKPFNDGTQVFLLFCFLGFAHSMFGFFTQPRLFSSDCRV